MPRRGTMPLRGFCIKTSIVSGYKNKFSSQPEADLERVVYLCH